MKKTIKLFSIVLLLIFSFFYTNKVADKIKSKDPIMVSVKNYKKKNDVKKVNGIINGNTLVCGSNEISVNVKKSYSNMKENNSFDKNKIVYETKTSSDSAINTYDKYIIRGNYTKKDVYLIFGIKNNKNVDKLINNKNNSYINYFVDGSYLNDNINVVEKLGKNIYNFGYNNKYSNKKILLTNNIIESITLNRSLFCLNLDKNKKYLDICKKNNMHTISTNMVNLSLIDLKKKLKNGAIIYYDLDEFDMNNYNIIIDTIKMKGYSLKKLSNILK